MLQRLRRQWLRRRLKDEAYEFLFDPEPPRELVSIDCETTTLDIRRAELLAVAAIRIHEDRILTSERLELVVRPEGEPGEGGVLTPATAMGTLLADRLRAAGAELTTVAL